jgi:transposase
MTKVEGAIRLTIQERRELQKIARCADPSGRASQRATVVLMSADGASGRNIARVLGMGLRTVREIRRKWRREGYEGLYDDPRSGRPRRADKGYVRLLRQVVQTDPRRMGYCFAHWTAPRLAEYLRQRTGIGLCDDHVRRLLKGLGFVWRKTKLTIRNLQNRGEKGESPETSLEASEGRCATGSGFRIVVRRRSAVRSAPGYDLRLSAPG